MILADYPGHLIAGLLLSVSAVLTFFAFRCSELQKAARRPYRWPLMVLQYIAIFILLLILWNPSRSKVSETLSRNSLLAFFDTSESMSVVEDGKLNRLDKALDVFQEKFSPFDADSPDYKVFGFDRQVYHCGTSDFLRRWGAQTDMHSLLTVMGKYDTDEVSLALENVQNSAPDASGYKNNRIIGAVIFTDGQADDKHISKYLPIRNKDFQITVIGVGSRERKIDIAIKSINAPSQIAINTACNVQAVVSTRNFQNQPVTVELLKDDYVVDTKEISAGVFQRNQLEDDPLDKAATIEFTIGADRTGSHRFRHR